MENKAWDILLDEEKSAISLSINHNKSTWEAGEIMGKAHYKYLEIQARAIQFYKMFTEYFLITGNELIPKDTDITWDFQEFILCTIQDRMGYRDTLKYIGKESALAHKMSTERVITLVRYLKELEEHKDKNHRLLYDLILEFDRWNNFRILPEEIQEPSAFKRRNKTRLLKHLKNINRIEPYLIDRLLKKFTARENEKFNKVLYMPVISETFPLGYQVIKIKASSKNVNYISKSIRLYMFKEKELADDYAFLVEQYLNKERKNCKSGQIFWPQYRELIKKASNYDLVNNIIPRRSKLLNAFRDIDTIVNKKREDKEKKLGENGGEERVSNTSFWSL